MCAAKNGNKSPGTYYRIISISGICGIYLYSYVTADVMLKDDACWEVGLIAQDSQHEATAGFTQLLLQMHTRQVNWGSALGSEDYRACASFVASCKRFVWIREL